VRVLILATLLLATACSNLTGYEPRSYVVRAGDTLYSIAWRYGVDADDLARWNNLADPGRIAVGQRLVLAPSGAVRQPAPPASRRPVNRSAPAFSWPVTGAVVARFGERGALRTGIGIAGSLGQDVRAAATGRVIYAGSGGVDYGQLVVIEHNETWLTAYGHNRTLSVAQGDSVGVGQKIAEMGLGPDRAPQLYFEIRRDGDPLDPLTFLSSSN